MTIIMKGACIAISTLLVSLPLACTRAGNNTTYEVPAVTGELDHTHAAFTDILANHVENGRVDYKGLKKDPAPLSAYLDSLAAVPEATFESWPKNEKKSFLINLYNASTLKLIVDHYPVKSIKDIGGLVASPWEKPVVRLFGKWTTLNHVEHDLLRPISGDARTHFAVNCASNGCPPLRSEAFQAATIDEQLDDQGRLFLRDPSKNQIDRSGRVLRISPIFKWYEKDFESGEIKNFVVPYLNEADRKVVEEGNFEVRSADYDWNLNSK